MLTPTYADLWSTCTHAARRHLLAAITLWAIVLVADASFAQSAAPQSVSAPGAPMQTAALPSPGAVQGSGNTQAASLTCTSEPGGRKQCAADTSAGVALMKSTGPSACLLGKTWGYDNAGVWVADGCGGEFQLGQKAGLGEAPPPSPPPGKPTEPIESWGEFTPGTGFLIGRNDAGELSISGYALARYINQTPASQTFTDHLGNERSVDGRNDLYSARVMVFLKGWVGNPKLIYAITFWTVNTTDQRAIFGVLGYQFHRKFSVYAGYNGNPGSRSLQGSHPYWLGHDRVMADEFFRPFFGSGAWVQGEPVPGLWYNAVVTNNSSALGVTASELDRKFTTGASVWWMPTTKEFGPRGAYGDWEWHEKLATRFGVSTTRSPEQRFPTSTGGSDNTTIRLADSVNVFDTGALAANTTVERVNYRILSIDAGMKYKGIFLQTEYYSRWLDGFVADGPLPVSDIQDKGFYVQGAFFPVPKKLEVYGATSQVFGDKSAGFGNSSEYLVGMNYYPANTRNHRLNLQLINVNRSPVSSSFGYYIGGQDGTTFAAGFSVFF
jgi:hypothetical protein